MMYIHITCMSYISLSVRIVFKVMSCVALGLVLLLRNLYSV